MNREEFLRQLDRLLSGISEEERADAIAFYRSYFEDAGEENEASVIAELESPEKVAESIMKDLGTDDSGSVHNSGENTGTYGSDRTYQNTGAYGSGRSYQKAEEPQKKDGTARTVGIVAAVVTSPIWLTMLLVIISILLAVVAALLGVAVAIVAVMASLVFSGFLLFGIGIANMFAGSPAVGIGLIGAGFLILALGILAVILTVWVFGVFLPWAIRGICKLCKKPFEKRKERVAA